MVPLYEINYYEPLILYNLYTFCPHCIQFLPLEGNFFRKPFACMWYLIRLFRARPQPLENCRKIDFEISAPNAKI